MCAILAVCLGIHAFKALNCLFQGIFGYFRKIQAHFLCLLGYFCINIKKGLFKKELVDFAWKGGRLAQFLNDASELRTMLIKISVPNIEISLNKKDEYVDISFRPRKWTETTVKISGIPVKCEQTIGRKAFPSREAFEAYDRIAQHVRSVIGA